MVLLMLLSNRPSLAIGALAIGLHNSGVMGRLLLESLQQQSGQRQEALRAMGSSERISWLYGLLSPQSPSYLAYGAYRSDVILRETVVVGVIGGSGLGWQLLESLFHRRISNRRPTVTNHSGELSPLVLGRKSIEKMGALAAVTSSVVDDLGRNSKSLIARDLAEKKGKCADM